ncbi:MAG: hypothetical protein OEZ43_00515 [Gammaproteobacteria bacterium]|nr:hypothetical protein [Gammaproteobacteria bacterium]
MKIDGGTFANMQQIQKTVSQIEGTKRTSTDKTIKHLEVVDAKASRSTEKVVDSAIDTQHAVIQAKGNFIDTLA